MSGSEGHTSQLKETPLAPVHRTMGARMVPFAGWSMPVQYTGVLAEHHAVRSSAGLFDLSHMGELWITGRDALANVQHLTTNDASTLAPGAAQYTFLTNDAGGIVDDLLVYCVAPDEYLLVVNAANIEKDRLWILENMKGTATLSNRSDETALLAIQGPKSLEVLGELTDIDLDRIAPFHFADVSLAGRKMMLARTGYTGEDGFELMFRADSARHFWEILLETGSKYGLLPTGLGARDTLRLEAKLCLYGNDLNDDTTPLEASQGFFVKLDKGDFIGRNALLQQKEAGVTRRLVGFVMEEKGIPRHGYPICTEDGTPIGTVTSGSFAPSLDREIGLGYVPPQYAQADTELWVQIRTRRLRARVIRGRFLQLRDVP